MFFLGTGPVGGLGGAVLSESGCMMHWVVVQRISQLAFGILCGSEDPWKKNTGFSRRAYRDHWGPPRWQKWAFHRKYNHFEKKFSKIDKNFVSQSILEVGHFTHFGVSVKKLLNLSMIIKIHQIYYRISYTKCQGFEKTPLFSQM